ncbi:hypothetical protein [Marinibactrum halimedae]|uniref:Ketosynthase n=1 Tax=Marinibactrum halimedae TaxID=1444977 RepID=A0AA37WMT8_9GAMM|nr:hypothetical protein [Marinibactrum halimedae]MCD9460430.1 hypothetical protein [Marinibactrum halimedae]GLS27439.1 hypothetical protein GCM10007877_31580 [Marinibactrum halimedae]
MPSILLIAGYPILSHLSITLAYPILGFVAFFLLISGIFLPLIQQKRPVAIVIYIALLCIGFVCFKAGILHYILSIPAMVIPISLFIVFGQTLLPRQVPLVTAVGESARGPLTESMRRYTRRVTQLWVVVLGSMAISTGAFMLFASPNTLSVMTNIVNYLIVSGVFVGEFYYRKYRFKDHNHPTFSEYLKIIVRYNPRKAKLHKSGSNSNR